jgi:hypothetical protein
METLIDEILIKLQHLPEPRLREVLGFVSALSQSDKTLENINLSEDPLLKITGMLSGEPIDSTEIDATLYGDSL